tara:strand:- start:4064 stop:4657 length:594 start_codon:yes stop_codon:yes gene_type:complete
MSIIQTYFDGQANNYQLRSGKGFWGLLRRRELAAVLKALQPFSGMTCLELGCGSGYYTSIMARSKPSRLIAVDLSHKMLCSLNIPGVLKVRADIQSFQVKTPFQRILCAGALEFLPDPVSFFCNVRHALSCQGFVILLVPKKSLTGRIYQLFHRSHGVQIRLFDMSDLTNMIEKSGLSLDFIVCPTAMTYVLRVSHA